MSSLKNVGGTGTPLDVALRIGIVVSALTTGVIHYTLGSLLFVGNAAGYVILATALVLPLALAIRFQWLTRLALLGFTLSTIVGWYLFGPRYDVAYLSKGIEVLMVALILAEIVRAGGVNAILAEVRALVGALRRSPASH